MLSAVANACLVSEIEKEVEEADGRTEGAGWVPPPELITELSVVVLAVLPWVTEDGSPMEGGDKVVFGATVDMLNLRGRGEGRGRLGGGWKGCKKGGNESIMGHSFPTR